MLSLDALAINEPMGSILYVKGLKLLLWRESLRSCEIPLTVYHRTNLLTEIYWYILNGLPEHP